jgi:hypothetical protein
MAKSSMRSFRQLNLDQLAADGNSCPLGSRLSTTAFCSDPPRSSGALLNLGRFDSESGCYSPSDAAWAVKYLGATCGPTAFSAACRTQVQSAMTFFPDFPLRNWTTVGDMRNALRAAGTRFEDTGNALPIYGLALLQLRVSAARLHPLYSLRQTHWVAVFGDCFYDMNWKGWLPVANWQELVLPRLTFAGRPAIDWQVRNGIQIVDADLIAAVTKLPEKEATLQQPFVCRLAAEDAMREA